MISGIVAAKITFFPILVCISQNKYHLAVLEIDSLRIVESRFAGQARDDGSVQGLANSNKASK